MAFSINELLRVGDIPLAQAGLGAMTLALLAYVGRHLRPHDGRLHRVAWWLFAVSGAVLSVSLAIRSVEAGFFALSNMYESLLMLTIGMIVGFLVLDRRFNLPAIGWPVVALCWAAFNFALTLPTGIQPLQASLVSYWRSIHVPIILFSYGLFALAFVASVLQLCQRRDPANQEPAGGALAALTLPVLMQTAEGFSMPAPAAASPTSETTATSGTRSMASLYEEVAYRCIALGFPFLTIGIILGGLWANEAWGNYWSWDPKESMALVTLLGYGLYLHLRVGGQVPRKTLGWVSVVGFALMLVTYFGVNIMGIGLHSYGKIG
jgi:cytochrome c-type biogenesis protein CcsB